MVCCQVIGVVRAAGALPRVLRTNTTFVHERKFSLPTLAERSQMLASLAPDCPSTLADQLAHQTHGFSFADLNHLAQLAHAHSVAVADWASLVPRITPAARLKYSYGLPSISLSSFAG